MQRIGPAGKNTFPGLEVFNGFGMTAFCFQCPNPEGIELCFELQGHLAGFYEGNEEFPCGVEIVFSQKVMGELEDGFLRLADARISRGQVLPQGNRGIGLV